MVKSLVVRSNTILLSTSSDLTLIVTGLSHFYTLVSFFLIFTIYNGFSPGGVTLNGTDLELNSSMGLYNLAETLFYVGTLP